MGLKIERIKACLNGSRRREDHPAVPITADELAVAAAGGASDTHNHRPGEMPTIIDLVIQVRERRHGYAVVGRVDETSGCFPVAGRARPLTSSQLQLRGPRRRVEVLFLPTTYELVADRLAEDLVVAIRGKVKRRDGGSLSVVVSDMACGV